jgi:E1A/CREB-binding protein
LMNSMRELKLSMSNDPLGALSGGGLLFNPQGATPPPVAQNQAPPMYPLQQQPPSTSSQSISQQHFSGTDINRNLTSTRPAINMCELNVFESSRGAVVTSGSSTHSNKFTTGNFTSGAASLFLRPGSSKKNDADWQKVRNKQQRLLLLRHASRCQHETGQCPVTPHCASMKELLEHIAVCKNRTCTVQHCRSSRYILRHYRRCKDTHCPTCRPVREKSSKIYSTRKNKCETVSRTFFI